MKKYRVVVTWNSGYIEAVEFEAETLAIIFRNACIEQYNIREVSLFKLDENGKIDWTYNK